MNYTIEKHKEGYALIENSTGHIVEYYYDRKLARYKGKFMSSGGAFNGFTPLFMCKTISENAAHIENQNLHQVEHVEEQNDLDHQFSVKVIRNQT